MKFIDPYEVLCVSCGLTGKYKVRDLLALQAKCLGCQVSLDSPGKEMRGMLSEWIVFVRTVDTVMVLEERLAIAILDADLENVQTGSDLVALVRGKVDGGERSVDSAECVRAAVERAIGRDVALPDLEKPLASLFVGEDFDFAGTHTSAP